MTIPASELEKTLTEVVPDVEPPRLVPEEELHHVSGIESIVNKLKERSKENLQKIEDKYFEILPYINHYFKRAFSIAAVIATAPATILMFGYYYRKTAKNIRKEEGSDAPVMYQQQVLVNDGIHMPKVVIIYKFRTMEKDARKQYPKLVADGIVTPAYNGKNPDDPRITKWGKDLRNKSVDELPQLWSVLIGDIPYIVGAERPQHLDALEYMPEEHKFQMRTGITGAVARYSLDKNKPGAETEAEISRNDTLAFYEEFSLPKDILTFSRVPKFVIAGKNC